MLSDCQLIANREQIAAEVPFEELRAIALRWYLDPKAKTPGSLKYRIEHRYAAEWRELSAPLTHQEYQTPFVQRYRTSEEIALDTAFEQAQQVAQLSDSDPEALGPILTATDTIESVPEAATVSAVCVADPEAVTTWQNLLAQMQMQLSAHTYATWVQPMYLLAHTPRHTGDEWRIGLPAGFALDWVKNRLAPKMMRILSAQVQNAVHLHFEVITPNLVSE